MTDATDDASDDASSDGSGDALPDDLDVTLVGPYTFPDIARRRIAAAIYAAFAAATAAAWLATDNGGFLAGTSVLAAVAAYSFVAGWPLRVDQTEALAVASRTVGFPVGHASAQLAWRGLRSRPTWRILVYSADDPPSIRGLVELDGVDARVIGSYTERNPEDWSEFAGGADAR